MEDAQIPNATPGLCAHSFTVVAYPIASTVHTLVISLIAVMVVMVHGALSKSVALENGVNNTPHCFASACTEIYVMIS